MPNYSFEQLDSCPTFFYDFYLLKNWFNPNIGTPDNYNVCGLFPPCQVPSNANGFQYASEGDGYSGLALFVTSIPNYREYVAVRLSDTLKSDMNYCIKFYVSLSEQYPKNISSIGVHFSPDSIHQDDWNVIQVNPQFENFNVNFISDTSAWLLIKGNYIATGGERYIYIGNFRNDANTVVDSTSIGSRTYVYIDNVQLYECDSLIGIEENSIKNLLIYPNPAQDFITLTLPQQYPAAQLSIYNLTGQLVNRQQIACAQPIPITNLNNGLYIFVIQNDDKILGRQRVVVTK